MKVVQQSPYYFLGNKQKYQANFIPVLTHIKKDWRLTLLNAYPKASLYSRHAHTQRLAITDDFGLSITL